MLCVPASASLFEANGYVPVFRNKALVSFFASLPWYPPYSSVFWSERAPSRGSISTAKVLSVSILHNL